VVVKGMADGGARRLPPTAAAAVQVARFRSGERFSSGELAPSPPALGLAPELFYAFQMPRDRPDGAGAA